MQKLSILRLPLLSLLALTFASAALAGQQPSTTVIKKKVTKTVTAGSKTVSGFIKGAPTGKTVVLAARGGTTTVDASNAKIRVNGKFGSWDAVKAGTQATVMGTMQGTTMMATDVNLHPRGGTTVIKKTKVIKKTTP